MKARRLRVLTGCTASGKTEWALRWAEAAGAEILSCDSLLFYRGMDIGTAKPTAAERARIPHHLIDILPANVGMNVARYTELARAAAEGIAARGHPVLVAGGSGFYLKSFFAPVADSIAVPDRIRAEVSVLLEKEGLSAVVARLREVGGADLEGLDLANPRRVSRALERSLATGRRWRELADEFRRRPAPFSGWEVELARLEWPDEALGRRIDERVGRMLQSGLVEEVRGLLDAGFEVNPSAARGIGYRETISMLRGRLRPEELGPAIAAATRALVKKQRTWFRTQLPPHPVLPADALGAPGEIFPIPRD